MDSSRRSLRHLDLRDHTREVPPVDPLRASTVDSGRGSSVSNERTSTPDRTVTSSVSSSLSINTPIGDNDVDRAHGSERDKPLRIRPTPVLGNKCYEQAFVSHVDHPSAFFLQLAHLRQDYEKLENEINEFYSNNPITNTLPTWKRGDYCVAKYKKDDRYYRARIIANPQENKTINWYCVVYIDYGNWDQVSLTDICPILPQFTVLTAQAIPCSLHRALPRNVTVWCKDENAMKYFENLVLEKYVNATFRPKSRNDLWPLAFVELELCSSNTNVHELMKNRSFIREVSNEEICREFNPLLKPADYIIYSISHEAEEYDDDDDDYP